MKELYFRVADALFCLNCIQGEDTRLLTSSYVPFRIQALPAVELPIFVMTVGSDLVSLKPEGKDIGRFGCDGIGYVVYKISNGYKILIDDSAKKTCCSMEVNEDFSICRVSLFGDTEHRFLGLNNAVMIAFAFSGVYNNIVLMHSSVTMYGNKGYLFLGQSGTGKSTHSRLWHRYITGSELLNDDNPAIRFMPQDGKIYVYGTPWSGKTPCYRNVSVEVGAFVKLEQCPENIIKKESCIKAFTSILSSCSAMVWYKSSYGNICDIVSGIVERIPVYSLKCRPDEMAVRLSFRTITG